MKSSSTNLKAKNKESFLCFCNKVEYKIVKNLIISNPSSNLNTICLKGNLANKCAACIPNLEDLYFSLRNSKSSDDFIYKKDKFKVSIKKHFLNSIDNIFGFSLTKLNGYLPMLDGKRIDTYLVMSNYCPKSLKTKPTDFSLYVSIYNSKGIKIKSFNKKVKKNSYLNLCLNKYVSKADQTVEPYYVQVARKGNDKGYRGSTRIHFFYKTKFSMASLHVQNGAKKEIKLELIRCNKNEKKFIFLMNTSKKVTEFNYHYSRNTNINGKGFIASKGCQLLEIQNFNNYNSDVFNISSKEKIKAYIIISNKNINKLSVDHL